MSEHSATAEPFNLSPRAAAALIGCHEDTLKRWAANGEVPAFRTPGGWWRFRESDIETFLAVVPGCDCAEPDVDGIGMCQTCKRKPRDLLRRPA